MDVTNKCTKPQYFVPSVVQGATKYGGTSKRPGPPYYFVKPGYPNQNPFFGPGEGYKKYTNAPNRRILSSYKCFGIMVFCSIAGSSLPH